ncbi:MAG TPA: FAD-binding oxidoreductase [Casimicrobiaceae bacterium]|nr:FAD-binding oxidoreductase [Casimicrobiaceae bacterium]
MANLSVPDPSTAAPAPTPYWWEAAPRPKLDIPALPRSVDVAVVGSGITGLNAARVLARSGRSVTVLDAQDAGHGASTRNAGFIGRTFKHRFTDLERRYGLERAIAVYRELQAVFECIVETIRSEGIECQLQTLGRLMPAASKAHYNDLARELEAQRRHFGVEFEMLPKARLREELATDIYEGGALLEGLGGLHPGLYHDGLLRSATRAGAQVVPHTGVTQVTRKSQRTLTVATTRGAIEARHVIIATNGYTGDLVPWVRRRLIPFDAFMIATEPLAPALADRVIPRRRVCIDTNHNPLFVRRSPDGSRILFGGLTGTRPGDLQAKSCHLMHMLRRLLPDLAETEVQFGWTGRCAATFDMFPHIGEHDGVHYAIGYCFAGVPMGTYLGQKVAYAILGKPEAKTVFASGTFPSMPLYTGRPWFVPALMRFYQLLDARTPAGALA